MKITNKTENALKVQIKGIQYEVGANDSISNVPKEHAEHWKTIHAFLEVSEDIDTIMLEIETKKIASSTTMGVSDTGGVEIETLKKSYKIKK